MARTVFKRTPVEEIYEFANSTAHSPFSPLSINFFQSQVCFRRATTSSINLPLLPPHTHTQEMESANGKWKSIQIVFVLSAGNSSDKFTNQINYILIRLQKDDVCRGYSSRTKTYGYSDSGYQRQGHVRCKLLMSSHKRGMNPNNFKRGRGRR